MSAATCTFPSIDAAVRTTIEIIQMGIPIARCELLDRFAVQAVNRHDKLSLTEAPMLLMEFHGSEASVAEQAATVQEIAKSARRRRLPVGDDARGAQEALGGAPPRLLRRPADEAGLPHRHDRHLRADLAPGRVGDARRRRKR